MDLGGKARISVFKHQFASTYCGCPPLEGSQLWMQNSYESNKTTKSLSVHSRLVSGAGVSLIYSHITQALHRFCGGY